MKNTFGESVAVTLFGESHGEAIGAVLDGIAPGIKVDEAFISSQLNLRRPNGEISTKRREPDNFKILSGVYNGKTTGTPIAIIIENTDTKSKDYNKFSSVARPGHADYTAFCKYHGFEDYRGGGHFSGRITAALVAIGSILISALKNKGIYIGTHIKSCGSVFDDNFSNYSKEIELLNNKEFAVINEAKKQEMINEILAAANKGDSVGGVLETAVIGIPSGLGEPWFDSVESKLAHIIFSVPAVKGVEFGKGFAMSYLNGSEANDSFKINNEKIITATNNNGGINGGITNGMPILFKTAIKPTPSISIEQDTVDFIAKKEVKTKVTGRHDPAIIHRARVVIDSVTAICLADILAQRFGTDFLKEEN